MLLKQLPEREKPCWKGRKELQSARRPRENVEQTSSAGNQAAKRTATASSCNLVEEMDEIKQQLKQLSGSLARITPVINEVKTAYDNYNQAIDGERDAITGLWK